LASSESTPDGANYQGIPDADGGLQPKDLVVHHEPQRQGQHEGGNRGRCPGKRWPEPSDPTCLEGRGSEAGGTEQGEEKSVETSVALDDEQQHLSEDQDTEPPGRATQDRRGVQ
jgi:hypothetical protein